MITALSLSPAVDKVYFVDNFEAGKLYRAENVIKSAGGKGINVSRVASILGEKVCTIGFKAGETGNWLEGKLKELGVMTAFVEVPGESRTNNNIIDNSSGKETEILEKGPFISDQAVARFKDVFEQSLKNTEVLVCSGGLPDGISSDFYAMLIGIAREKGIKTILDTSKEVLTEGIKSCPYLIKPNLRELSDFAGRPLDKIEDIVDTCRTILMSGVEIAVVSMGRDGALFVTGEKVIRAYPPKLTAVNTIGSGDSMVAGMAAGIIRDYSPENMFKLGMACAAANTQFKEIGYITVELVEKYMSEIKVEYL
ncbi:MAG: 1-phosphofructokinase [Bacillota bacterium]|nr:1-phosphofructokinase [Bacillota bacterium]